MNIFYEKIICKPENISVALRVTYTSLNISYSITSFPIDNPHRGSGDLLGVMA